MRVSIIEPVLFARGGFHVFLLPGVHHVILIVIAVKMVTCLIRDCSYYLKNEVSKLEGQICGERKGSAVNSFFR